MSDRSPRLSDEFPDDWSEPSYEPDRNTALDGLSEDAGHYGDPTPATGDGQHIPPDWVRQLEADAAEHSIPTSTARITDDLALFQPRPIGSEHDSRDVWVNLDQPISFDAAIPPHVQAAFDQIGDSVQNLLDAVTPSGFQMGDEREGLLWGLINTIDFQVKQKDQAIGQLSQQVLDLRKTESQRIREQGRDPASLELEEKTAQLQSAAAKRDVLEAIRDYTADIYFHDHNKVWEPRKGTHVSQSEDVAKQIDSREFIRAREKHLPVPEIPEGTLIAVGGTKVGPSYETIIKRLDTELKEHPDMILAHGGAKGVQTTAAKWAKANKVPDVVFLPDFDKKNAIPRRDEQMLRARPDLVITFTAEGERLPRLHTGAIERGISVETVSDRRLSTAVSLDAGNKANAELGLHDHQPAYDGSQATTAASPHTLEPSPNAGFIDEQKREHQRDRYAASFLDPGYHPGHARLAESTHAFGGDFGLIRSD